MAPPLQPTVVLGVRLKVMESECVPCWFFGSSPENELTRRFPLPSSAKLLVATDENGWLMFHPAGLPMRVELIAELPPLGVTFVITRVTKPPPGAIGDVALTL